MSQEELKSIFKDFIIIYNNKRPEDNKLNRDPQNNPLFILPVYKTPPAEYQKSIDEIYNLLVMGDIESFEYMMTSPNTAWAREGDGLLNDIILMVLKMNYYFMKACWKHLIIIIIIKS